VIYGFLRSHREEFVLFAIFFPVYLFSGMDKVTSVDFLEYPFGSDPPCYTQFLNDPPNPGNYMIFRHPVTAVYCLTYNEIISPFRDHLSIEAIYKIPFALIGALNVLVSLLVFRRFVKKYAFLCSLAYGFTSVIWFFGVFPESYMWTAFLVSVYILFTLKYKDELNPHRLSVLTVLFMLGIMNDASFLFTLIIPITVYFRDLIAADKSKRRMFILYTLTACMLLYIMFAAFCYSVFKRSPIKYYRYQYNESHHRNYKKIDGVDSLYEVTKIAVLNFYFFNFAFPDDHVSHMTPQYGKYVGYFQPSLKKYFDSIFSIAFLAIYFLLLFYGAKGVITGRNKVINALLLYILLRSGFIFLFNPVESLLYSSVIILPVMMLLFHYFVHSAFRFKAVVLFLFVVALIGSNARFFV
jgi:hypothetical protein